MEEKEDNGATPLILAANFVGHDRGIFIFRGTAAIRRNCFRIFDSFANNDNVRITRQQTTYWC